MVPGTAGQFATAHWQVTAPTSDLMSSSAVNDTAVTVGMVTVRVVGLALFH